MSGIIPATHIADHYGEILFVSMIIADVSSVGWYLLGKYTKDPKNCNFKSSGSVIYDFFMGTILYPRIGDVDIKVSAYQRVHNVVFNTDDEYRWLLNAVGLGLH